MLTARQLCGKGNHARRLASALEMHREKARTKYFIELPAGASGALES